MAEKKEKKEAAPKAAKPKAKKAPAKAESAPKGEFTRMKFNDCVIARKRSGRFEVIGKNGKNLNGADKIKILLDAKLIQASVPKAAPAEENTAAPQE